MSQKLGPFLCEWCSTPLDNLKGTVKDSDYPGEIRGLGYCPKCCVELWSKPVKHPPAHPEGSVKR